jgi:Meckel syndrome type 1 protein
MRPLQRINYSFPLNGNKVPLVAMQAEAFSSNRIFTYINADEYSDRNESDRTITTSQKENQNPLVMMMHTRPQHRNEVLKHQTLFVMADCGVKAETEERVEFPLALVRSYPDGSFDMRPGFNRKDEEGNFIDDPYEFEDFIGLPSSFTTPSWLCSRS